MAMYLPSDYVKDAMEWGLRERFKQALRDKFQAAANEVIEEAVKAGLAAFESEIKTYMDYSRFDTQIVEVILTDKRSK